MVVCHPLVPRTDLLASITTENTIACQTLQCFRIFPLVFNGLVRDALAGIHFTGSQCPRGASLHTTGASTAIRSGKRLVIGIKFCRNHQYPNKTIRAQALPYQQSILSLPSQTGTPRPRMFQNGSRVHKATPPHFRSKGTERVQQKPQTFLYHLMVIFPPGIQSYPRNILGLAARRIIIRQSHYHRPHPRHQTSRIFTHLHISFHVSH